MLYCFNRKREFQIKTLNFWALPDSFNLDFCWNWAGAESGLCPEPPLVPQGMMKSCLLSKAGALQSWNSAKGAQGALQGWSWTFPPLPLVLLIKLFHLPTGIDTIDLFLCFFFLLGINSGSPAEEISFIFQTLFCCLLQLLC